MRAAVAMPIPGSVWRSLAVAVLRLTGDDGVARAGFTDVRARAGAGFGLGGCTCVCAGACGGVCATACPGDQHAMIRIALEQSNFRTMRSLPLQMKCRPKSWMAGLTASSASCKAGAPDFELGSARPRVVRASLRPDIENYEWSQQLSACRGLARLWSGLRSFVRLRSVPK